VLIACSGVSVAEGFGSVCSCRLRCWGLKGSAVVWIIPAVPIWFFTAAHFSYLCPYPFTSVFPPFLSLISQKIHYLVCLNRTVWHYVLLYCGRTLHWDWSVAPQRGWWMVLLICCRHGGLLSPSVLATGQQMLSTNKWFPWDTKWPSTKCTSSFCPVRCGPGSTYIVDPGTTFLSENVMLTTSLP